MRNLTITRKKSFVGCVAKISFYMQVSENEVFDMIIDGIPCRLLGKLKNGETKSFSIEENSFKIFAIADALSKSFCREIYYIDNGTQDITLTGKCVFNPAAGNAFRFDNNNIPSVIADRKRNSKKGIAILLVSLLIGGLVGFFGASFFIKNIMKPIAEEFTVDDFAITLDTSFENIDSEDANIVFLASSYQKISITVEKPVENLFLAEKSEMEIADLLISSGYYSQDAKPGYDAQYDLTYIEYENKELDSKYIMVIEKNEGYIWLCHFGTTSDIFDEKVSHMLEFADTISFE